MKHRPYPVGTDALKKWDRGHVPKWKGSGKKSLPPTSYGVQAPGVSPWKFFFENRWKFVLFSARYGSASYTQTVSV